MRVGVPVRLRILSVTRRLKLYHLSLITAGVSALLGAWHYTWIFLVGAAILFYMDRVVASGRLSHNGFLVWVFGPAMPPEIFAKVRTVSLLESVGRVGVRKGVFVVYFLPIDVGLEHASKLFREVATAAGWTVMKKDGALHIGNQPVPTLAWATMVSTDRPEVDVAMLHECDGGYDPEEDGEHPHDDRHVHLTYYADDLSPDVAALVAAFEYALYGV